MSEITDVLAENPILIWLGIILALIVYGLTRYLETLKEEEMEVPQPSSLDDIVKPKVEASVNHRGEVPGTESILKFGRNPVGQVKKYLDTTMPKQALNPDPNTEDNVDEGENEEVRIIRAGSTSRIDELLQTLKEIFSIGEEEDNEKLYIFRKESFLDHPGDDMVIDPDVLSYEYAGMEVEASIPSRNVVSQMVQIETQEKLLSAIPNYAEKVDYLFPIHSQKQTTIKNEGEYQNDGADF